MHSATQESLAIIWICGGVNGEYWNTPSNAKLKKIRLIGPSVDACLFFKRKKKGEDQPLPWRGSAVGPLLAARALRC
jgi:hypothetical protein